MLNFLSEYGMFLLQALTLVVAILVVTAGVVGIASKGKDKEKAKIKVKKLNEKYKKIRHQMMQEVLDKKEYKKQLKAEKKAEKADKPEGKKNKDKDSGDKIYEKRNIFVLRFEGDIKASAVENLRREVSAVLSVAKPKDEVFVILESAGGMVHSYGLAASQLQRIKDRHIPLITCVDKVAASGGYLMACVADRIIAAPFAIIGSIGVIAQLPNFNRWLKKNNIEFEQITAGEYKRTLTMFGENTNKARHKMQQDIEEIHHLFKDFVEQHRQQMDIETVSTGEHWLAKKAFELKLVDELSTSDDYLIRASKHSNLFEVTYKHKKRLAEKLAESMEIRISNLVDKYLHRSNSEDIIS